MFKKFISLFLCVMLFASPLSAFAAYEVDFSGITENPLLREIIKTASRSENSGLMYPPEEHPYIYVNDEFIAQLKANKGDEVYKATYDYQLSLAKKDLPPLPADKILTTTISNQLCARAFMYVMGEVDKNHAKETVDYAIKYLTDAKSKETYTITIYKDFGNQGIQCGALIYDWCYSAMTASQKSELADKIKILMYDSIQPCTPDNTENWSDVNGKGVGQTLIYNCIAVSALYDMYPDMYDRVMKKVLGTMAEVAKIYGEAGALTDGSTAYTREYYTYFVQLLFQRMGHDVSDIYGMQLPSGYKLLYGRLPYGTHLKTGDSWTQEAYQYGTYSNSTEIVNNMGLLQVMYEDPYLKHIYQRDNSNANSILDLLLFKSYHEAKTPDDLPLAFEAYSPRSEILHKTSWQEGLDSPQVTAYLNMNNRRSGDHDHCEYGSFQLHYKGPLTISNGNYKGDGWGDSYWRNYLTRSISKNCMLVYDPGESYVYGSVTAEANDGGQLGAGSDSGAYVISKLSEHFRDDNIVAVTEGTYIGPNEQTPAFSYIKGDLTKSYSEGKMASYKRGMVFMDTFDETYPGVLVVFDHVVSKNASFKKTWLLQGVAEPHIDGNKITIINSETDPTANGKLVNYTLLPEKVDIGVVGGINKYITDGVEYPFPYENKCSDLYKSGWRAEVSPSAANKEDVFLNAMFVADADTKAPDLKITKIENDNFIGVYTLDRQVMFSKNGKIIDKEFSVKVENSVNSLVLITDVKPGKWKVSGAGKTVILESKDYDNAFVFEGVSGETYTISPAGENAEITNVSWQEEEKEKIGDFAIKVDKAYQYMREPNKIVNGVPYIGESFVNFSTECNGVRNGDRLVITTPDGQVITLTAGSRDYTITNAKGITNPRTTENPPFIDENGVFYFNHSGGIGTAIGLNVKWIPSGKALICTKNPFKTAGAGQGSSRVPEGVDESKVAWPVSIYASSDDGNTPANLMDGNLDTRWSSVQGDGEWACLVMGDEPVEMSSLFIAWYNGDKRNWKFDIQISNDGEAWTYVLQDKKSGGKTKGVEEFKLPAGTKAKYIRYVGHGEEVTGSLYNSVTEFIVTK